MSLPITATRARKTVEIAACDDGPGAPRVLRERFFGSGAAMAGAMSFHQTHSAWLGTVIVLTSRVSEKSEALNRIGLLNTGDCRVGVTQLRRSGWIVRVKRLLPIRTVACARSHEIH